MQRILEESVIELAEGISACEESGIRSPLLDELIRASYGMAFSIVRANDEKDPTDKALFYEEARKRAKEVGMLLDACYRRRIISEAANNRTERKLASVKYKLTNAIKENEQRAGKAVRRLPKVKNIFHTRRLTVRTFLKSDTEKLLLLFEDALYKECSLTSFDNGDELYEYLKTEPTFYAVTRKGSGEVIGAVGIFADGHGDKRVKIELGILPEFRACGYFSELVEETAKYAYTKLNAEILAVYLPRKRSYLSRALIRLGFKCEGTLASYEKDGEETAVYSLTK